MKELKCSGCGSRVFAQRDEGSVTCQYCQALTILPKQRVSEFEQLASEIEKLTAAVKVGPGLAESYAKAKKYIMAGDFLIANELIDEILSKDINQARAWFYKSLLPFYSYQEQLDFIDLAIINSSGDLKAFYEKEKKILEKKVRRKKRDQTIGWVIVFGGLGLAIIGGTFLLLHYLT